MAYLNFDMWQPNCNVSNTFWKICKAKFDALTQFPEKDTDTKFEKQIKPYLLKITSFHQILNFKRECKI